MENSRKVTKHIILFLLTIGSTFLVRLSGDGLNGAMWYSAGIMSILLMHEMGHYVAARKYGVPVSLPFFIPVPLPPFGTMGAVIKMSGRMPNRRALFDIGVSGPLAGLALIIPAILWGLSMSRIVAVESLGEGVIGLGDSLLFKGLAWVIYPNLPEGHDIVLHPLAYSGWVGLYVTAINLLPISQLDGGHLIYALFGKQSKWISSLFYGVFTFVFLFYYMGWLLLIILLAIFPKHPPTLNDHITIDRKRQIIGGFVLLVFILSFTPVPFGFGEGLIPVIQGLIP